MNDPQLHHARWLEIESVVAFWDILITLLFIVQGKEGAFYYYNPYQKTKKQLKDFIKMILCIHAPQLHLNCLIP